jgi:serine/threonine protein kinase
MENLFRADCDYWDEAEDNLDNRFSTTPRLPKDRGYARGRSPPAAPLGQRLSGIDPEATVHRLLGASVSSSSSGPKLAPSINCDEESDSRIDGAEAVQVPAGAVQGENFCWVRGELIGRGSMGFVHRALEARTGQLMAVKEVLVDVQDQTDEKFRKQLQNEVDLYKDLNHPCIVAYLGHDYTIEGRLFIFLEYMPGGSIAQVLSQFGPLDESLIARYTCNLLDGLEYLHTHDPPVLHRDIKGANILVGMAGTVKLSDFGCSKRSGGTAVHTLRGSIPWMAPEVMCQSSYGRKADIWSLGCVLIEMSIAAPPWGHFDNCLAAMARIAMSQDTPPVPTHLSEVARDFVALCTRRVAQDRPDAVDLLKHKFVEGSNRSSIDESWG